MTAVSNPASLPGAWAASGDQRESARSSTTVAAGLDSCSSWRTMRVSRWAVARQWMRRIESPGA